MTQKKLILHVGFPKTATSSIQGTLLRNTKLLEEQGIHYPDFGWLGPNHVKVLGSLFDKRPKRFYPDIVKNGIDIGAVKAINRGQFEKLLSRKNCTILISAEHLAHSSPEILKKIESVISQYGWSIEVIAVIRSPLSVFLSNSSQSIKRGRKSLIGMISNPVAISKSLENLWSVFDNVRTYSFSDACRHLRGPVGYFLNFLGIENADAFDLVKANEGLSNNAVRLLSYVNGFEPWNPVVKKNPNQSENDLKVLWTVSGPRFRLTLEEYEAVREHVEFENAWLESNLGREYCDEQIELRRYDVHWDEESLRTVRNALPDVPEVLAPYIRRYFEEKQGIVLD